MSQLASVRDGGCLWQSLSPRTVASSFLLPGLFGLSAQKTVSLVTGPNDI